MQNVLYYNGIIMHDVIVMKTSLLLYILLVTAIVAVPLFTVADTDLIFIR